MGHCGSKREVELPVGRKKCLARRPVSEASYVRRENVCEFSEVCLQGEWNPPAHTDAISKATLVLDNHGQIEEHYAVDKVIQCSSSHGTIDISRGRHLPTGKMRAVKTACKANGGDLEYLKHEIMIMKQLDHPNIVKLYETYEDTETLHLVMEVCSGGPLLRRIVKAGRFSEGNASVMMQQILHAVSYMHVQHQLCHRDLKLESCLLASKEHIEECAVKLADFGLARLFQKGQIMTTKVGSALYMSPQVLAGRYDEACDSWSMGVIMYILLSGNPPFKGENEQEVLAKVKKGTFSFNAREWMSVSEDAKDLIKLLMKREPHNRYTPQQALSHSWARARIPKAADFALHEKFMDHLRCFGGTNDLKKTVLHIIAGQLTEQQSKTLRETFVALDLNGDGLITAEEMKEAASQAGVKHLPADFTDIMASLDSHKSGGIDYSEFLAASLEKREYLKETVCWKAFSVFDRDHDGFISQHELKQVLNSGSLREEVGEQAIEELMREFDNNGDGKIDFEEFMLLMLRNCSPRRGHCHRLNGARVVRLPSLSSHVEVLPSYD